VTPIDNSVPDGRAEVNFTELQEKQQRQSFLFNCRVIPLMFIKLTGEKAH